jgi:predicted TIM-barrel fold metal-dependent hydrolase
MRRYVVSSCALAMSVTAWPITTPAQPRPLPVIDVHFHVSTANNQGPPPLAVCPGAPVFPVWDQQKPWPDTFLAHIKKPPCANPVWSPKTDDELRDENIAVLNRRNVIAVAGGPPARVAAWRRQAAERMIPALALQLGPGAPTPDTLRELHSKGHIGALAEVSNQYVGIAADDPAFEPYLAAAEQLDIPVGIHIGTGPPGAPYLGFTKYRARLHSPLQLEDPLLKHPKLRLYVMHAGWPMLDDTLAMLWAHPQLHVEVGVIVWALPRVEFYRYLQRIVDAGFGKRVMFGSDQMVWPGVIEPSIRIIEEAPFLSAEQTRDILYNNAARFLRLTQAEIDRHHGR